MNRNEYSIMYRVEDRHWWYAGLRGIVDLAWSRHIPADARVLDVGCGTGANLAAFRQNGELFGIDYSPDAIRLCRLRAETKTAVATALALPFADESFDAVLSCDVLCHRSIRDKKVPLSEMNRVLRPGGIAVMNLPAYQWLYSSHDRFVHTDRRFTSKKVRDLLKATGFAAIYSSYWNTLLFPIAAVVRLWRKRRPPPASDLDGASGDRRGAVLRGVVALERNVIRRVPMPFGLSVLVVAKKQPG